MACWDVNDIKKPTFHGNYNIQINPECINDECARTGYQMYIKSCVQLIGLKGQLKHRLFMYIPRNGNPKFSIFYIYLYNFD